MIDAIACLGIDTGSQSLQQYYISQSNNQESQKAVSCSIAIKDSVAESIHQCVDPVLDTHGNNQENRTTISCSYVSGYTLL